MRFLLSSALFPCERSNAKATDRRRIVEHYRVVAPEAQEGTKARSRATPGRRPFHADRARVGAAFGHSLEDVAPRDGLWFRGDLLATAEGLAASRRVEASAPSAAREASPSRAHRLLACGGRQLFDPRPGSWEKTGPNPTHPRRPGSKHHLLIDAQGIPLSAILTKANRHAVTQLLPLIRAIPPIGGKRGAPRRKPKLLQADPAYDSDPHRAALLALSS